MRKKLIYYFLGIFLLIATICFFTFNRNKETFFGKDCPFCQSFILDTNKFYEDDLVMALCTHKPIMPGHCLVIPKRHVERFEMLSDDEVLQIFRVIHKVDLAAKKAFGISAYLLWQKNGREVGQTVPHVHFHYIPRKTGDGSVLKFIFKTFLVNAQKPIEPAEIQKAVEKMKTAMDEPAKNLRT